MLQIYINNIYKNTVAHIQCSSERGN